MNNSIPAVEKTIALLNYLSENRQGATQAQLKKELKISMSSAYRILQTLLDSHWVRKSPAGIYRLGNGLLPLFTQFRGGVEMMENFQHIIDRVVLQDDVACKISVRRGKDQVTLMRAEPNAPITLTGKTGSHFPVVEGSVGAALLCRETDEAIRELLAECPPSIPEKENSGILLQGIESIRKTGYAVNKNNRWHITALSAPVMGPDNTVFAALTFIIPELSSKGLNKLGMHLKNTVRECEKALIQMEN